MNENNENNEEVATKTNDEANKTSSPHSEYVKELLKEKISLNAEEHSLSMRLLDEEILKAQSAIVGKTAKPEWRFLDLSKEKHIKVITKVLVPVKEHPKFNFVGKLLGPKGNSLKRLQEDTMTKMAILGRGSIRDKAKEEELRNSLDPKYSHLSDELHVEIQAHAAPAEAYARIAYALAEIRKYLIPDVSEEGRPEQLHEAPPFVPRGGRAGGPPPMRGGPGARGVVGAARGPLMGGPVAGPRSARGRAKVMSILDKVRSAVDESYGPAGYDDGGYYDAPAPPMTYGSTYNGSGYYDTGGYGAGGEKASGGWKSYGGPPNKHPISSGGGKLNARFGNARSSPYGRQLK